MQSTAAPGKPAATKIRANSKVLLTRPRNLWWEEQAFEPAKSSSRVGRKLAHNPRIFRLFEMTTVTSRTEFHQPWCNSAAARKVL